MLLFLLLCSCMKRKYADLVIHNAHIYTLDEKNYVGEAMAIHQGIVLEVGPERQILNKYRWGKSLDAEQRSIYPGFTDAFGHFASHQVNNQRSSALTQSAFVTHWLTLQQDLLRHGIVEFHDGGLDAAQVQQLMQLDQSGKLNVRVYAMLQPNEENFRFAEKIGVYTNRNLTVRSFYLSSTEDVKLHQGWVEQWAQRCINLNYQLAYYPADSSEMSWFWKVAREAYQVRSDHRWRLMVDQNSATLDSRNMKDFAVFVTVCPAVSKVKKAEREPIDFRSIIEGYGIFALASNFPMNAWNPWFVQQELNFRSGKVSKATEQASLTFQEQLKAVSVWPQFAAFHENIRGSLSDGYEANFFIAEIPINASSAQENLARMTFIRGRLVYDATE